MKNLKNYDVQELRSDEAQTIEGGFVIITGVCLFALGVAIGAGISNKIQRK